MENRNEYDNVINNYMNEQILYQGKRLKRKNISRFLLFLSIALVIVLILYQFYYIFINGLDVIKEFYILGIYFGIQRLVLVTFLLIYFAFLIYSISDENIEIEKIKIKIISLEEERELNKFQNLNSVIRAEKQFRFNQKELQRYYDLNLQQTKYLYKIGILLIIIGIAISISTILISIYVKTASNIIIVSSFITGILIDFIGAIFIIIYTKTIDSTIKFQSKLAENNRFLLANLISTHIINTDLKEATLSEIAKNLSNISRDN